MHCTRSHAISARAAGYDGDINGIEFRLSGKPWIVAIQESLCLTLQKETFYCVWIFWEPFI